MRSERPKPLGWEYDELERERFEGNKLFNFGTVLPETFHSLKLDLAHRAVRDVLTGKSVKLTDSQYQMLWLLYRANGTLLPMERIHRYFFEQLPENQDIPLSNTHEAMMTIVRKAVESVSDNRVSIHMLKGHGYSIVPYAEQHKEARHSKIKATGIGSRVQIREERPVVTS